MSKTSFYSYSPCTKCKALTVHASGICGPCRMTACRDCGTQFDPKMSGRTVCTKCTAKRKKEAQ